MHTIFMIIIVCVHSHVETYMALKVFNERAVYRIIYFSPKYNQSIYKLVLSFTQELSFMVRISFVSL